MSYIPAIADPYATRIPTAEIKDMKETWRHRAGLIPAEYNRGYDNHAGRGRKALSVPVKNELVRPKFVIDSRSIRTDGLCSYEEGLQRGSESCLLVRFEEMPRNEQIFHQQIGLEITRIHGVEPRTQHELENFQEAEMNLASRARRFFSSRYPLLKAHGDCDAMEFPSPPCGSIGGLLHYWNHYTEACTMYNHVHKEKLLTSYTYKKKGTEVSLGTGGLHIHIAFPDQFMITAEELKLFKWNMNIDAANNPHIAWLFQDWYKNGTNPYLEFSIFKGEKNKQWDDETLIELMTDNRRTPFAVRDERMSFRSTTNTTEYRCFETPDTFAEVADLIEFVNAHQAKIFRLTMAGVKLTSNFSRYHYLCGLSIKDMLRQYNYDFEYLDVDGGKYLDKFFEKHYVKRKKNGTVDKLVRDITN